MTEDLFLAVLAMDSYHRDGDGINLDITQTQIGLATRFEYYGPTPARLQRR